MTKVVRATALSLGPNWSNIAATTRCYSAHPQRTLQMLDPPVL